MSRRIINLISKIWVGMRTGKPEPDMSAVEWASVYALTAIIVIGLVMVLDLGG